MAKQRNIQYEIKRPSKTKGSGKRATYSIQKVVYNDDGSRSQSTIKEERLDIINSDLAEGLTTSVKAEILVQEILADLRSQLEPKTRPVHNDENRKLLDRYWAEDYAYRDISSPESMKYELENAIELVGTLSLITATPKELQDRLTLHKLTANQQRRTVDRLNSLLRFAGRTIKLKKMKKPENSVKYLTRVEFAKVLIHVKSDVVKLAMTVAFETGLRAGEIFDLEPEQCSGNQIYVKGSLSRDGEHGPTKTRKSRFAYGTDHAVAALKAWFKIKRDVRDAERAAPLAEIVKSACRAANVKVLTFRDLRHCYAVQLISKGVSISLTAQSMGNSVTVCQDYYAGYSLTAESVSTIQSILAKNDKPKSKKPPKAKASEG